MQKALVQNFMSSPLFFVKADYILEQAEKVFHDHRIIAAPVLIDKTKVIGVLTDYQLLKMFLARSIKPSKARIQDFQNELDPVILIEQGETIESAFKMMLQSPIHRIYVTDQGRLVGALSPRDLLPILAGDTALERQKESKDLIAARIRIKELMAELSHTKDDLSRYRAVFNESPYMIHSVNLEGEIIMANKMLHVVLGYPEGQLVGKTIYDLYPQQFHQQAKNALEEIKGHGFHPFIHTLMVKKNKELIQTDIITKARHDANGEVIGTITISRVSDTHKMLELLKDIV